MRAARVHHAAWRRGGRDYSSRNRMGTGRKAGNYRFPRDWLGRRLATVDRYV